MPLFFIIREKPKDPPSLVSMQERKETNFVKSLSDALKLKNYILLLIAFGLVDGSFIAFGSVLGPLFAGIFSPSYTSIICGATTVVGLMMSFGSGILIQRKQKFRAMMRFSCIGTAVVGLSLTYLFTTNRTDLIAANVIMIGVVIVPIIPVGINFSGELTFPIEPTVATGTLMMTG